MTNPMNKKSYFNINEGENSNAYERGGLGSDRLGVSYRMIRVERALARENEYLTARINYPFRPTIAPITDPQTTKRIKIDKKKGIKISTLERKQCGGEN